MIRQAARLTTARRGLPSKALAISPLIVAPLLAWMSAAQAQEIEPRAYSNAPIGVNFLVAGYARTRGALSFDTAVPVTNAELKTSNAFLGYARVIELWGQSAKLDVILPYSWLSGTAEYRSEPTERIVDGFADPKFRLSANLLGAPALTAEEFASFKQDLIVGVSLQVSAPWGQYDDSRVVNLGTHRWSFKPEIGVSKALGPWTLELAGGATIQTDNQDFLKDRRRSQEPIYSAQGHLIRALGRGIWGSVSATYFTGGKTKLDDQVNDDLQRNWRLGGTLSLPLNRHHSIKLYASSGVSARTGNNYDLMGIAWQYRWGGGR